ncbi:MAG: hypothetical protein F4229_13420 [Gammaproteobacteria bacterium]|nr:hypothetical protein [Gammaproteobacteria bacterium]
MTASIEIRQADLLRGLARTLREVRQANVQNLDRMFRSLGARLATARRIEAELDRVVANRFNPLDYLRTDELGLSRILADLLDPNGPHGQGAAFLAKFLERIRHLLPDKSLPPLKPDLVEVHRERLIQIDSDRRLDVSIEISGSDVEPLCIAIENKPFAADGEGQVEAYLKFLRCRYPKRFLLIYLSPHGGPPSAESLPTGACTDGLATLSYGRRSELGSRGTPPRLPFALTDWLRECALACPVDRLRWFLRDTENFCHRTFGGAMATDTEHREVRDFILESKDNLHAALAVLDAYPQVRNDVVAAFLKCLYEHINDELEHDGWQAGYYFKDNTNQDGVWAYRSGWTGTEGYTPYVWLGHDGRNASRWYLGVGFHPFGEVARDPRINTLRDPLAESLGPPDQGGSANWPWYRYLNRDVRHWAPLLVQLNEESASPGALVGRLTSEFVTFARKASPIIHSAAR